MQIPQNKIPHIVFLFSDTGGGHRSAAEAILEAMSSEFPGKMTAELVDIFRDYAPTPLNRAAAIYPPLSRMPEMWGLGYKLSDGAPASQNIYNSGMAVYPPRFQEIGQGK